MQRVDGNYLYSVGCQIHPLSQFKSSSPGVVGTSFHDAWLPIVIAEGALDPLLSRSVFRLKTSVQAGHLLLTTLKSTRATIEAVSPEEQPEKFLDALSVYVITDHLRTFENVLAAELALLPMYVITPKAEFDTEVLFERGALCFPADIFIKAPEAVFDLEQATKCIAFEIPTAAGFHLHRATEAILRRYWDAVTHGDPRPKSGNMGDFLREMTGNNFGDEKVRGALRHLKDFYRNPIIHPEHNIENIDDAISLMNSVHTALVQMLKDMPEVVSAPVEPPVGSLTPSA